MGWERGEVEKGLLDAHIYMFAEENVNMITGRKNSLKILPEEWF